jgi:hypothetical protein
LVKRKLGMSEEVPGGIFSGQARVNTETEKLSELSETNLVWLEGQVDKKIEGESRSIKRCAQAGKGLGDLGAVGSFWMKQDGRNCTRVLTWELATHKRIFRRLIRKRKGAYRTEALNSRTPSGSL